MIDIILIVVIILIIICTSLYIYKAKKHGKKCIGCPHAKQCSNCNCTHEHS